MPYASQIKIGTLVLAGNGSNTVQGIIPGKVRGSLKTSENGNLIKTFIPGKARETRLFIQGTIIGTNRDSDRTTLKNYDDGQPVRYEDGFHDGNYVIDQDSPLAISDSGNSTTEYVYTMTLLEYNQ